jgi:potassium-transporting ATPase KdpC subunit
LIELQSHSLKQHNEKVFTINNIVKMLRLSLALMVICGLVYPVVVTGIAQFVMPKQADGSLIYNEDKEVIGSELIGQKFSKPEYFSGRVSSIEYDATGSGSPNYAPSNADMLKRTKESIAAWEKANPAVPVSELPVDLITNSGSGLDPHISPEAADVQVPRISELTGIGAAKLKTLIKENTQGRELGLFGEPRVNVLTLNLALEKMLK